jgi:hypothetical protein
VDCGDASLADCRAFGGERLVKGDVLLAVEQSGEVEIAEVDTATTAEDDDLCGERLLGGCRGVLRGELASPCWSTRSRFRDRRCRRRRG